MVPTFKQLEAFHCAATCANFATAAQRLHVSVSSLSKRLVELELALGHTLFDRSGHRAVLTGDGVRLLAPTVAVLDAMTALQGACRTAPGLSGRCRFGVGELSALIWLPRFVARIRAQHPGLSVEPYVDVGAVLERRVEKGELDFAVIAGRSSSRQMLSHPVGVAQFAWMAAPAVAAEVGALPPTQWPRWPLVTLPAGAGTTRLLDDWLLAQGLEAPPRIECNHWLAIAGMLREGLGLGFLPESWALHPHPQRPLQVLTGYPPLAPLHYAFQWQRDDRRDLIAVMRELVSECVDFSTPV